MGDAPSNSAGDTPAETAWSCEEIERLYRQALDAVEAVANDLSSVTRSLSTDMECEASSDEDGVADTARPTSTSSVDSNLAQSGTSNVTEQRPGLSEPSVPSEEEEGRLDPAQVIEALLFVGGQPLTAKTICDLLRSDFDAGFVEQAIAEIEHRYSRQNRPYEIRRGEGGYRIALRSEYEPLRNRVYGFGPKQVRLSQEALEILALVAYRQPISRRKTEEIAKRNAGSALRQLSERGLLVLERPDGTPLEDAQYRTSARFLQLFGVARLDDLPQIEDINYK
jgi:segregation and condensation protein B